MAGDSGLLSGRVALVTGASRGIGAAVARLFAREGAHVILLARSRAGLAEVDDLIRSEGGTTTLMPFDLSKTDELQALGPTIYDRFGRLDIFVSNVGSAGETTPVSHSSMKLWKSVCDLDVLANVQMIRTLEPLLKASDAGRAILTGSARASAPHGYDAAYATGKSAAVTIFRVWAEETRQSPLRVNIVDPGPVDTDQLSFMYPGGYQGGGVVFPEDVAPLYLDLALPACARHGEIVTRY